MKKNDMIDEFKNNIKILENDIKENQELMDKCKENVEGMKKNLGDMIRGNVNPA